MADVSNLVRAGVEYPPMAGATIKVRATRLGEYEYCRRREGDVFVLKPREITVVDPVTRMPLIENGKPKTRVLTAEEQFSPRWMERVDDDTPEALTSAQEALDHAQTEITEARRPGRPRKET